MTTHTPTSLADTRSSYGWVSIALHWLVAAAVIYLYINGEQFAGMGRSPTAGALRALHNSLGAVASVLIAIRIAWRAWQGAPAVPGPRSLALLAHLVQWALLATLAFLCVSGFLAIWSGGRPVDVFGLLSLPPPIGRDGALHRAMEEWHGIAANLMLALVALHVLAAVKHAVIDRDGVLSRMLRPAT